MRARKFDKDGLKGNAINFNLLVFNVSIVKLLTRVQETLEKKSFHASMHKIDYSYRISFF